MRESMTVIAVSVTLAAVLPPTPETSTFMPVSETDGARHGEDDGARVRGAGNVEALAVALMTPPSPSSTKPYTLVM